MQVDSFVAGQPLKPWQLGWELVSQEDKATLAWLLKGPVSSNVHLTSPAATMRCVSYGISSTAASLCDYLRKSRRMEKEASLTAWGCRVLLTDGSQCSFSSSVALKTHRHSCSPLRGTASAQPPGSDMRQVTNLPVLSSLYCSTSGSEQL